MYLEYVTLNAAKQRLNDLHREAREQHSRKEKAATHRLLDFTALFSRPNVRKQEAPSH